MTPDADARIRIVRARTGAFVLDTLLAAYALWCIDTIRVLGWDATSWLARFPHLLLTAPLLAALWESSGASIAQRGHGLRLVDADGQPAGADARATAALGHALVAAVVALPALFLGLSVAGVVLSIAVAVVLGFVAWRDADARSLGERLADVQSTLERRPPAPDALPWYRRPTLVAVLGLLLLTLAVGWLVTGFEPSELVAGAEKTVPMWRQLLDPDWSITGAVVAKMVETIFIALIASVIAVPIAFVLSFLGARNLVQRGLPGKLVYGVTRFLMNLVRSVEPVLWAIIFSIWVGVGPDAGMLALLVHSVAALGKLYSEAIESIDPGPVEAVTATGATRLQVIRYGVVPQVVPQFLAFTVYRWDINVRMATILGFVGGGGIGEMLVHYTALSAWSKVGVIVVFMTLVVWALDAASARARERLV